MKVVGVRGKMKQDFYFLLKTLVFLGGVTRSRVKRVSAPRRNIVLSVAAVWTNNSLACQLYSLTLVRVGGGSGRKLSQRLLDVFLFFSVVSLRKTLWRGCMQGSTGCEVQPLDDDEAPGDLILQEGGRAGLTGAAEGRQSTVPGN